MPERSTKFQKKRNIQSEQIKNRVISQATPKQTRPSPRTPQPQRQPQQDTQPEQPVIQQRVEEQPTVQSKDILTGRTIEQDQLGVDEESDTYKEGLGGVLEGLYAPTQQMTQMGKDIIEGVPAEQQAMRPSMIDLAVQPVIGTLAAAKTLGYTERDWWSPIAWFDNPALPVFLQKNPEDSRDFIQGMSDNFGVLGDTVTNERWLNDVNKGVDFEGDGVIDMVGYDQTLNVWNPDSEIRKYPGYYIGSAIGELPYFLSPAIAIRGPVQTAKILASATRVAGKASLSMKNISTTSKLGNIGKNVVKTIQKEKNKIGTDKAVNTKAANEGLDLLEKNIDNQIAVKEKLSIEMSKKGLSDNKLAKTVDDLENEIAELRKEKAVLRDSHDTALTKFNEARGNYQKGLGSIDDVNDARSRYITAVQRGVEDKVAVAYKANKGDIIKKYEALSELHRVKTTTKIRELQKKVDSGELTERQVNRTKNKIDKLERSLDDELPRADRVARAIEGAPEDAVSYVKKIVPKHRWSSIGRELEQTTDSAGRMVYSEKKTKYEDMYKRYDGNEVLAGIVYSMRKAREGLGFAFHKTEKSLTEQIQFNMREKVVTVSDASRPELGLITFRAGDSVEAATRVKAAYGDVRASMARRDKIRADVDAMKPDPKKDDFIPEDLKEAEMDVQAKMNVLSEIMGEYEPISDFKVNQIISDADGSKLFSNYADVPRGKGDAFIKVEPTSDIQVTVATRIPDVQMEKLGKGLYQGSVGKEMTVIASKTDVKSIQSVMGKDSTYLTKGKEWVFQSYQAKDPVSLRGGRSVSQGNAYVQIPAGIKIEDYLNLQVQLGLDTPQDIQVGIKKYKDWQKYKTAKGKEKWRRVTKEQPVFVPDTLEGGILVPYKKLTSVAQKDVFGEDKSALNKSTVRLDLERDWKMDGKSVKLRLFPDEEDSPTIESGNVITNRDIFEGRITPEIVASELDDIRATRTSLENQIDDLTEEISTIKKETDGVELSKEAKEYGSQNVYSPETKSQLLVGQKALGEAKDYAKDKKQRLSELKDEINALKGKLSGEDLETLKKKVGEIDGELTSMEYGITEIDQSVLGIDRQTHQWNIARKYDKASEDVIAEYDAIDIERNFAISKYELIKDGRYTHTDAKGKQLDADIARLELQRKELAKRQVKVEEGSFDSIGALLEAVDQTLAIKKSMKATVTVREFKDLERITPKVAMSPEELKRYENSDTRANVESILGKLQAEKTRLNEKKFELNQKAWAGIGYKGKGQYPYAGIGGRGRDPLKNDKLGEMTKYLILKDRDKQAFDEGVKSNIALENMFDSKVKLKQSLGLKEATLAGKQKELKNTMTRLTAKDEQLEDITKKFELLEKFPQTIGIPRGQIGTWTEKTLAQQGGTAPVNKPLYFTSGDKRFEIVTMVKEGKESALLKLQKNRDELIEKGYAADSKERIGITQKINRFKADESNYQLTAIDYDAKISGKGVQRIPESELMAIFKTQTGAQAYTKLREVQDALAVKVTPKKQPDGTIKKTVGQRAMQLALPSLKKAEGVIDEPVQLIRRLTGGRVEPVYAKGIDYTADAIVTDSRVITGDWKHYRLSAVLETTDKVPLLSGGFPVGVRLQQIYKLPKVTETSEAWQGTGTAERLSRLRDNEIYIPIEKRVKDGALPLKLFGEIESKMSSNTMKANLRESVARQYYVNIEGRELSAASAQAKKVSALVEDKSGRLVYSDDFNDIIESVMTPDRFRRPTVIESVSTKRVTRKGPTGQPQTVTPRFKKIWRTFESPGVRHGFVDIAEIERDVGVAFRNSAKGTRRDRAIAYIQDMFPQLQVPRGAGDVREQIIRKALLETAREKQPWHKFNRSNRKVLDSGTRQPSSEELALILTDEQAIIQGTATKAGKIDLLKETVKEKATDTSGPLTKREVETKEQMVIRIKNEIEAEEGVTFSDILSGDVRVQLQKRMSELNKEKTNVQKKGGDTTEINAEVKQIQTTLAADEKVKLNIDSRYFEKINQAKEARPPRTPYYAGVGSYTGASGLAFGVPLAYATEAPPETIPTSFLQDRETFSIDVMPQSISESTLQVPTQAQKPVTDQLTQVSVQEARAIAQDSMLKLDITPKAIQTNVLSPALATGTGLATLPTLMLSQAQGQMQRYTTVSQMEAPPALRQGFEVPRPPGLVPPSQRFTPPMIAGWPPWLEDELEARRQQKGKSKKKKKQFWTVPDQWYKPGYWQKKKDSFTGKYDYTGTGYGTFKGREGKRLKNTWDMQ